MLATGERQVTTLGDREATGRRQGGGRKTTDKRQEGDREATGNSDRRATGGNDRRATGERQEGARQKLAWRQETTGSDRKRQDSDRRAAQKRQGSDRGATGERQDSDRRATGKRQGSDRGLKVPKQPQGGDREATGWRQESEVARIYCKTRNPSAILKSQKLVHLLVILLYMLISYVVLLAIDSVECLGNPF